MERFLLRHRARGWVRRLITDSKAWARLTERGAETSALLQRLLAKLLACPSGSSKKRKRGAFVGGWSDDDDSSRSNSDNDGSLSDSGSDS